MSRSAGADRRLLVASAILALTGAGTIAALGADEQRPAAPPGLPPVVEPASNRTDEAKVALGKKLFAEGRLSSNGKVSCAHCHLAEFAFSDGLPRPSGVLGEPVRRNAPTILNVGFLPKLFWDGRVDSLEEQARLPILAPDEMGMTEESAVAAIEGIPEYPPLFERAFGDRTVTLQRIARAIAAFERTLVAGDSPFDRWWGGDREAIDESAQRGYALFIDKAGCSQCHSIRQSYAIFTDGGFHVTGAGDGAGLTDPGRYEVTKRPEDMHAFRTPPLRNVALTAPYMHDGSLRTLEEVVDFYAKGGGEIAGKSKLMRPVLLSDRERADLVAFMKALTSAEIPKLEECEALLAAGRPREALEAFRRELEERGGGDRALLGLARAAIALDDGVALTDAEGRVRRRLREISPAGSADAAGAAPDLLVVLGRLSIALIPHEDAMAQSRQDDALMAWRRVRDAVGLRDDAAPLEAGLLEARGRGDEAIAFLAAAKSPALRILHAKMRHRRGWRAFVAKTAGDADRADLAAAAAAFDELRAADVPLDDESMLLRATARHWLGETAPARAAYLDAARSEPAADRALRGLRNLLVRDLATYRKDLAALVAERPDSPSFVFLQAWEDLEQGRTDEAERGFRRRIELGGDSAAGAHVCLARIAKKRGERGTAISHYAAAFALDGRYPGLAAEYEALIREPQVRGWDDVDRVVAEYRRYLDAGPDDASFQIRIRNNLAFLLRDIAAAWTSRGPARLHTFAEGSPQKAKDTLRLSLSLYEESASFVPDDVSDLPFAERWVYAGVLNDLGLMLHYFPEIQDLERAEKCYLRAFEMTDGAYQDAYFYNLQFLYAFELDGRDEIWWRLAKIAKDAILKEDPSSPTGFSPDEMKRTAARRDFDRLSAELGH